MKHTFKLGKKAIALLLALLMTLSVFSIVGFAEDGSDPAGPFTVTFYKCRQGTLNPEVLGTPQTVNYGESATVPQVTADDLVFPYEPPTYRYHYVFTGSWSADVSCVTQNMDVYPLFEPVAREYHITYYNWDKTELNQEQTLSYGDPLQEASTPSRADTDVYTYSFAGWALKPEIDLQENPDDSQYLLHWSDTFTLPALYVPKNPNATPCEISVYPYFIRSYKEYEVTIKVTDSAGAPVEGAWVHVLSASGQALSQTRMNPATSKLEEAYGLTNSNGEIVMYLPYQDQYTFNAGHDILGTDSQVKTSSALNFTERKANVVLTLTKAEYEGGSPRCTDICHGPFGGIWIFALNLMYYLFRAKYVCCEDMYATHQGQLAYGP